MTTSKFVDRFDRDDGEVGAQYTIPCGNAALFDEAVIPVDPTGSASGLSAFDETTAGKTQVLYIGDTLDGPDQSVRGVWIHMPSIPNFLDIDQLLLLATQDPSFTICARMTKDPLLVDLGTDEQPFCFDQGYGLRVTCPRSGAAPILKIIKYSPLGIPPGIAGATTATEVDLARVLASATLGIANLHVDPAQASTSTAAPDYRGFVQSMRLRIRRQDDEVILEAYLNERHQDLPIMSFTDREHPLWGVIGVPGFEFISATLSTQPAGSSPYGLKGIPVIACQLFDTETIKDTAPSRVSQPSNRWTYERVTERVITLVEKNGDTKYNATTAGQTKLDTYLDFVMEAEADLIREEGYYDWLYRESTVILTDTVQDYELPENVGELEFVAPDNWSAPPLAEVRNVEMARRTLSVTGQGAGRPQIYSFIESGVNDRPVLRLFPTPTAGSTATEPLRLNIFYYARLIRPHDPTRQLPFVPQQDMDVLTYSAAAVAMLLDTDAENIASFLGERDRKISSLRRKNNRKLDGRQTIMRSAADVHGGDRSSRFPQTRMTQLGHLLVI